MRAIFEANARMVGSDRGKPSGIKHRDRCTCPYASLAAALVPVFYLVGAETRLDRGIGQKSVDEVRYARRGDARPSLDAQVSYQP